MIKKIITVFGLLLIGLLFAINQAGAVNLIQNGDMATKGAWEISVIDGSPSINWGDTGFNGGSLRLGVSGHVYVWQAIDLIPGKNYQFSLKYKIASDASWFVAFSQNTTNNGQLPGYGSSKDNIGDDFRPAGPNGNLNGEGNYSRQFMAASPATYYFGVKYGTWGGGGSLYIDDVSLECLDCPTFVASFTVNSNLSFPLAGETVSFTSTSTGTVSTYLWDFGDGSPTSSAANPTHVYSTPGVYTASLTINDGSNNDTTTKTIRVLNGGAGEQLIGGDVPSAAWWTISKNADTGHQEVNTAFTSGILNFTYSPPNNSTGGSIFAYHPVYLKAGREYLLNGQIIKTGNNSGAWFNIYIRPEATLLPTHENQYPESHESYLDKVSFSKLINTSSELANSVISTSPEGIHYTPEYDGIYYLVFKIGAGWASGSQLNIAIDDFSLFTAPITTTWQGATDNWKTSTNWNKGVPIPGDNVIVSTSSAYPLVPANTKIANITFKPNTEIGNQHLLTYNKAFVQYDFTSNRNRWNMLSIPLKEVYGGDFSFGGYPVNYLSLFGVNATEAEWIPASTFTHKFTAGDGFIYWITDGNDGGSSKGLGKENGILELPYYERLDETSLDGGVHPNHIYSAGVSSFYMYQLDGGLYVNSASSVPATRTADAYRLADSQVIKSLTFGIDSEFANSEFAHVGNPFMTTINFDALATDNPNIITANYMIWTGAGFTGFTPSGLWGKTVTAEFSTTNGRHIAPLQSFIVEKGSTGGANLTFNIANIQATNTASGGLKSKTGSVNKLNITADNGESQISTFIAQREDGKNTLCVADARKLFAGIAQDPDIYTLKACDSDWVAVGANILADNDISVPLGILTDYTGEITFTFSGMDSYEADILFVDKVKPETILLSGVTATYTFTLANAGQAVEDRFEIQFAPKTPTGFNDRNITDKITTVRYYNLQGLEIARPEKSGVYLLKTIYSSGKTSVTKQIVK